MQIARARVVAQPIPRLSHRARAGRSKRAEIRESLQKPRVELFHSADLGLLQHYFGHEHLVRVPCPPPRQVAGGALVPGEEPASKRAGMEGQGASSYGL